MKLRPHKLASVVARLELPAEVEISRMIDARPGQVLAVRALEEKRVYDVIELTTGRKAHIGKGDVLVGALGRRDALEGFVGRVPASIRAGDTLHVLNLGGVLGLVVSENKDVGHPLRVEVLGMVLRDGRGANIADVPLPEALPGAAIPPVIVVSGTCMNSGKTSAAVELIARLTERGYVCGGAKLTGVAALRDTLNMQDHGAVASVSFVDAGLPSTAGMADVAPVARRLLGSLVAQSAHELDVIVAEMGDGIIGSYGVESILIDPGFRQLVAAHVLCANDLVAAWGSQAWLAQRGLVLDVVAGPATDNDVGLAYVRDELGLPAANARTDPEQLTDLVERAAFRGVLGAGALPGGACARAGDDVETSAPAVRPGSASASGSASATGASA
ncbi:MAG: hypothetical protein DRQ55_15730 [Planctomycetota bacterium]|nr:MAG: hypothetical protein DRQ55_15730 [Planctomycetota bacterium]